MSQFSTFSAWAGVRNTDVAVAAAIHDLAARSETRTPEDIWEDPSRVENDDIRASLARYVLDGLIEAPEDGKFCWGDGAVTL